MGNLSSTGYLRKLDKSWDHTQVVYRMRLYEYTNNCEASQSSKPDSNASTQKCEAIPLPAVDLNPLLGKKIAIQATGKIRCVDCGRPTKKSFAQGSCYSCFTKLACNDLCIVKPSQCHYHLGTCRQPEWGDENCFKDHSVYLSITSGAKVGITRETHPESRWIDQGAVEGIVLVTVPSRREAGIIEDFVAKFIGDKTSWQAMVTGRPDTGHIDLALEVQKFLKALENADLTFNDASGRTQKVRWKPAKVSGSTKLDYPILRYPRAKSLSLETREVLQSTLIGIKGQYLLLEDGVVSLRKYQGYEIQFSIV